MKSSMTCRIMARRDAAGVRLLTRNGRDFAGRFPMAAAAVATLPRQMFQEILRLIAELRPKPPPALA